MSAAITEAQHHMHGLSSGGESEAPRSSVEPPTYNNAGRNPACNLCRDKKIRCGREKPTCQNCSAWKVRCTYSDRVKRDSEASRTAQRFEEVNDRLERIESTMKTLVAAIEGLSKSIGHMNQRIGPSVTAKRSNSVPNMAETQISYSNPHSPPGHPSTSAGTTGSPPKGSLVVGSSGSTHYLGSSSFLSITQEAESLIADEKARSGDTRDSIPRRETMGVLHMLTETFEALGELSATQGGKDGREARSKIKNNSNIADSSKSSEQLQTDNGSQQHKAATSVKSAITAAVSSDRYSSGRLGTLKLQEFTGIQWDNGLTADLTSLPPTGTVPSPFESTKLSLPDEVTATSLVDEYFKRVNIWFPLFEESRFRARLRWTYAGGIKNWNTERGWLACLNNVLLFGIYGRPNHQRTPIETRVAGGFFFNAWTALDDISVMLGESIENIQALCSAAVIAIEISKPGLCWNLLSQACRLAMAIGLHRNVNVGLAGANNTTGGAISPDEKNAISQERKYVFWNLYILDKTLSLTFGRPTCLPDFDCDVELPEYNGANPHYNCFVALIGLSKIQSGIYVKLYSANAQRASEEERRAAVDELDAKLSEWWRESGEIALKDLHRESSCAEQENQEEKDSLEKIFSELELRFSYHNSLMMIHRMAPTSPLPASHTGPPPPTQSSLLCLSSARASIQLIQNAIAQNTELANSGMLLWLFQYYPFTAFFTLFAEIVRNPQGKEARKDWELMRVLVRYLDMMRGTNDGAKRLGGIARAFTAVAWGFLKGRDGTCLSGGRKRRKEGDTVDGSPGIEHGRRRYSKRKGNKERPNGGVDGKGADQDAGNESHYPEVAHVQLQPPQIQPENYGRAAEGPLVLSYHDLYPTATQSTPTTSSINPTLTDAPRLQSSNTQSLFSSNPAHHDAYGPNTLDSFQLDFNPPMSMDVDLDIDIDVPGTINFLRPTTTTTNIVAVTAPFQQHFSQQPSSQVDDEQEVPMYTDHRAVGIGGIFAGYFGGASVPSPPPMSNPHDTFERNENENSQERQDPSQNLVRSENTAQEHLHRHIQYEYEQEEDIPSGNPDNINNDDDNTSSTLNEFDSTNWRIAMSQVARQGPVEFDWFAWDGGNSSNIDLGGSFIGGGSGFVFGF